MKSVKSGIVALHVLGRRWANRTVLTIAVAIGMGIFPPTGKIAHAAGSPTNADLIYRSVDGNVWIDSAEAANQILTNFILKNDLFSLPDFSPVPLFPEEVNATFARFSLSTSTLDEISWSDEKIFVSGSTWASEIGLGATYNLGAVLPTGLDDDELAAFLTTSTYVGDLGTGIQTFDLFVAVGSAWHVDASGDWTTASNWLAPVVPNANTDDVIFGNVITAPVTVTTNTPVTARSITFSNTNSYTIDGSGSVNLEADVGDASLVVDGAGVAGAHQFQTVVNLKSNTDAAVETGALLSFDGPLNLGGNVLAKTGLGRLNVNDLPTVSGGAIQAAGGVIGGSGTVGGDLSNTGATVAPGQSVGVLTVDGDYSQGSSGALEIEVAGLAPGTEHDQLDIAGTASLDGTLSLEGIDSLPSIGDHVLTILNALTVSGTFASVPPPNNGVNQGHLGRGIFFEGITYNPTSVKVELFQGAAGDTNGDRLVDTTDITNILAANVFENGNPADWTTGDFTGDGLVTTDDITAILALNLFEKGQYFPASPGFAVNPTDEGTSLDGVLDLIVQSDGTAVIDTNGLAINGFVIESLGGHLVAGLETLNQANPGLPTGGFMVTTEFKASSQFINTSLWPTGITGIINLGQLFGPAGSVALFSDLDITYTVLDTVGIFDGECIGCVPEPSAVVLFAMGLLGAFGIGGRWRQSPARSRHE